MGTINDDIFIGGTLQATYFVAPANSIGDAAIPLGAGIQAEKLEHLNPALFSQNGSAAAETRVVFVAAAACTVEAFRAGSVTPAVGVAVATLDLRKNGVSVLTAPITLDSANAAYTPESGTLSGAPTLAAGDVLTVVATSTPGGGTAPTGMYAVARVHQLGQ
jgi:hypothetical protein